MNTYIGTKILNAKPMTRQAYNELRGWTVPVDDNPDDEGFLVEYVDGGQTNHPDFKGYISWSPNDVFERAYRPTTGMTFGQAMEAMKIGKRVARTGWNGEGMWVALSCGSAWTDGKGVLGREVPASQFWSEHNANFARENGGYATMMPFFTIKNANNTVSTWVPSINDCLAEDWTLFYSSLDEAWDEEALIEDQRMLVE